MPPATPSNRNGFALAVLFLLGVIVTADILAITSLGNNSTSTFSFVTVRPQVAAPAPQPELAPIPRPVD